MVEIETDDEVNDKKVTDYQGVTRINKSDRLTNCQGIEGGAERWF